jgi:hypothetical protein
MHRREQRPLRSQVEYTQVGLALEYDTYVIVRLLATIHPGAKREMRISVPGESYGRFQDLLQRHTEAAYKQGRANYLKETRVLQQFMRSCRSKYGIPPAIHLRICDGPRNESYRTVSFSEMATPVA